MIRLWHVSFLFLLLLSTGCERQPRTPFPMEIGKTLEYDAWQLFRADTLRTIRRVTIDNRLENGDWSVHITENDQDVSRKRLRVDHDTVKTVSIQAASTNRVLLFDPCFPDYVPGMVTGDTLHYPYTVNVFEDSLTKHLLTSYTVDLKITRLLSTRFTIDTTLYEGLTVLRYIYPESGVVTDYLFSPEIGKIAEYTPQLSLGPNRINTRYLLRP